jgi:hypothetical protein
MGMEQDQCGLKEGLQRSNTSMMTTSSRCAFRKTWSFVLLAVVAASMVNVCVSYKDIIRRYGSASDSYYNNDPQTVEILACPRYITPTEDFRQEIHVPRLGIILDRARPLSPKPMISISVVTHALRLWGRSANYLDGPYISEGNHHGSWQFSSDTMLSVLLDADRFEQMYPKAAPLIAPTPYGVSTRYAVGHFDLRPITTWPDCEAHIDKTISVLGEIGVERDYPVHVHGRLASVADMLQDSMMRFSWRQELDFSAKAYLLYLLLPAKWANRYGERITTEGVIRKIIEQGLGRGSCVGTHQCHAMALALRIDAAQPYLSVDLRRDLQARLQTACSHLEQSQLPDGGWPSDWTRSGKPSDLATVEGEPNTRLRVTGHHLEWIAIAPKDTRPSAKCIKRAIHYLQDRLLDLPGDSYYYNYTLLTHAARALLLFSGQVDPMSLLPKRTVER